MNTDLELVDTTDLIRELMRRCDTGYIILASHQTVLQDRFRSARRGPLLELIGLLEWAKHNIVHDMQGGVHSEGQELVDLGCDDPNCDCNRDDEPTELKDE